MSPDTRRKGDSRNKCTLCLPGCLHLFISCKKGGDGAQNILTGNLYQHEKEKKVSFAFQGIASPYPSWNRRHLWYKETSSWCERQRCKKTPLIHVILTELFCIYTSFTKMEAGSWSLHIYILSFSPIVCHSFVYYFLFVRCIHILRVHLLKVSYLKEDGIINYPLSL